MLNIISDTNVAPVHGSRPARWPLSVLFGLLALAAPLSGQAKPGHFYHVNYYQARPGEEKAYDSALVNVVTPVFDEMVKRKAVVSYLLLTKMAGSGEYTNIVIVEVATLSAAEGIFQRDLDASSQAGSTSLGTTRPGDSLICADSCTPNFTRRLGKGANGGTALEDYQTAPTSIPTTR